MGAIKAPAFAAGVVALVLLAACTDYAVPPKGTPTSTVATQSAAPTTGSASASATASSSKVSTTSATHSSAPHVDFASGPSIIAALNRGGYHCGAAKRNTNVVVAKTDYQCTHAATNDTSVSTYASAAALKNALAGFGALLNKDRAVCGAAWCVIVANYSDAMKVSAILKP